MTEPTPAEAREVPLYVLRAWYIDQVELSTIRTVAAAAGLGRTTLHKFVAGETMPHPRIRRLLALHYLRQRDVGREEQNARAGIQILAAYLPEEARARFIMQALDLLERGFVEWGRLRPEWIARLRAEV